MIALSLIKNKKLEIIEKKVNAKLHSKKYRLKILYSGICASDIPRAFEAMSYKYPLILGHEFVGEIIERGINANKFEKGDIVTAFPLIPCFICENLDEACGYCKINQFNLCDNYSYYGSRVDGSFCEILDVYEWNLFKIKNKTKVSHKSLCLMEPVAVAYNIFDNLRLNHLDKKKILVLGAGFISQVIIRVLSNFNKNNKIFLADRNLFKLNLAEKFVKNKYLFSLKNNNYENIINKIFLNKFDIVIELTGSSENFINAINFVKKEGKVIYAGNINKDLIFKKNEVSKILRKQIEIKGIWNSSFKSKNNNWNSAFTFLKKNNLDELVTNVTSLENSKSLLNVIYKMKKGLIKNTYLKGVIKV